MRDAKLRNRNGHSGELINAHTTLDVYTGIELLIFWSGGDGDVRSD